MMHFDEPNGQMEGPLQQTATKSTTVEAMPSILKADAP